MTLLCWHFGAGGQRACLQRGEESIKDVLSSLDVLPVEAAVGHRLLRGKRSQRDERKQLLWSDGGQ